MSRKYQTQQSKQKQAQAQAHRQHSNILPASQTAHATGDVSAQAAHARSMLFAGPSSQSQQQHMHASTSASFGLVTELEWNLLETNTLAELVERLTHGPVAATAGAGGGIGGLPAENSQVWRAVSAGLMARADAIGEHQGSFFTNKCCYDKYAALRKQYPDTLRQQRIEELEEVIAYRDEMEREKAQQTLGDQANNDEDAVGTTGVEEEDVEMMDVHEEDAEAANTGSRATDSKKVDKSVENDVPLKSDVKIDDSFTEEDVDKTTKGQEPKAKAKAKDEKEEDVEVKNAAGQANSGKKVARLRGTALQLSKYIRAVAAHKYAYLFKELFDQEEYPDYYGSDDPSKESMTLISLRSEVEEGKIDNAQDVYKRMMNMFDKAIDYFKNKSDGDKEVRKEDESDEDEDEDDIAIEAKELKHYAKQVADEFQLLRTAEAMESSKPTTRRRHAGNVPDNKEEKRGKASNEQDTKGKSLETNTNSNANANVTKGEKAGKKDKDAAETKTSLRTSARKRGKSTG